MRGSYWHNVSPMQKPITRQEIAAVWSNVARLQEANGDKESAKESRRVSNYFAGRR